MPLPNKYLLSGEGGIASYDSTDIFDGVGIVEYYGYGYNISGADYYGLTREALYPSSLGYNNGAVLDDNNKKYANASGTTDVQLFTMNFDSAVLTLPRILQGSFSAMIPSAMRASSTSAYWQAYVVVTLKKVSASGTETSILSLTSKNVSNDAGANASTSMTDYYFHVRGDVPLTKIKIGEKIRITVELRSSSGTGATTMYSFVFFDANNRAITFESGYTQSAGYTRSVFSVPFKIDL